MNIRSIKVRAAAVALTVLALVVFNKFLHPSTRSEAQLAFESWLADIEPQLSDTSASSTPDIELAVVLPGSSQRLGVSAKSGAPETLRLLQLVREGNLLSLGEPRPAAEANAAPPAEDIALLVTSPKHTFLTWIGKDSLNGTPQGQLLLKLTQVYSLDQQQRLALSSAPQG